MRFSFILLLSFSFLAGNAQSRLSVHVKDSLTGEPLPGVSVIIVGTRLGAVTNTEGKIFFSKVLEGNYQAKAYLLGYRDKFVPVEIPLDTSITILLSPLETAIEELTVTALRTNARMEDSPLKVEVLGTEEMDEENSIKPGNITSLLGDISGIQIQQSSSVSANSNVRIQGLGGKYTQILRDGLPLYEGFSGSFGILQIPPLDLRQIEIIKGTASTLYGGGAIGGIINLVSKEPGEKNEGSITLNQSTLTERNFNGFCSVKKNKRGATIFSGVTYQNPVDVNGDGFSDVPKIQSLVIHPRLFFFPGPKTKLAIGFSSTYEVRRGGDMNVLNDNGDSSHTFFEEDKTDRNTGDLIFTHTAANKNTFTVKGSASFFDRTVVTDTYRFYGTQVNGFGEISYLVPREKNDFVGGVDFKSEYFEKNNKEFSLINDFSDYTVGAFVQNTWKKNEKLFLEAGLRTDYHSEYGFFFLPRTAALYKLNDHWYSRVGFALGYLTPDPLVEQNTETDLRKILPIADSVEAERSAGLNLEINYKTKMGEDAFLYFNHAFFYTEINAPVVSATDSLGITGFYNEDKPVNSAGWDTYLRMTVDEFEIYFGYTYTMARQEYDTVQPYVTLTPRNRAATIVAYEIEGKWRFALEGSYSSFQYRDDGSRTPDYFFMAAMIERKFKHASLVLNGENILDERQSKHEKIVTGPFNNPTFKPLWGPIDGRVINLSLVLRF